MHRHLPLLLALVVPILLYTHAPAGAEGEVWIDVRSPMEHMTSSIVGHINVPHTQIAGRIGDLVPAKGTPVYVYCSTGRRAGLAKETLEGIGYTNVTNVGSISAARRLIAENQQ